MKILLVGNSSWNHPIPYFIAPQRIARALTRAGHEVFNLDVYGESYNSAGFPPNPINSIFQTGWGKAMHASLREFFSRLDEITRSENPDLIYVMGTTPKIARFLKGRGIPFGLHKADPFYEIRRGKVLYPSRNTMRFLAKADFLTCNEGQAWNYLRQHGMEEKVHLLSHAVDPELSPTLKEVKETRKKYLCSTVVGGDDPYRRVELIKYYYQWTDYFPDEVFIIGGGTVNGIKWGIDKEDNKKNISLGSYTPKDLQKSEIIHSTEEDIKNFSNRLFNITKIYDYKCSTFPSKREPMVLCHKFIHRLYSQSYYGFTPYGWYITEGPQSEYQVGPLGTKTTEMGGSGAAMIANRINGIDVLIKDGKTGFVLERPEDTKDIFQYAIDNPDDVRKMGLAAYDYIHKHHSWDVRYRDVLAPIFEELGLM